MLFVAATFVVGWILDGRGERLGTPRPPFAFDVDAEVSVPWLVLAIVVALGAVVVVPRVRALRHPVAFAVALVGLALVLRLAIGALRFGPEGWDDPFNESFEAKNEYL